MYFLESQIIIQILSPLVCLRSTEKEEIEAMSHSSNLSEGSLTTSRANSVWLNQETLLYKTFDDLYPTETPQQDSETYFDRDEAFPHETELGPEDEIFAKAEPARSSLSRLFRPASKTASPTTPRKVVRFSFVGKPKEPLDSPRSTLSSSSPRKTLIQRFSRERSSGL